MENHNISAGLQARLSLQKHGFAPSHSLGQNFILDEGFLTHLLDIANLDTTDNVLEIGPGPGLMTRLIAERCSKVAAVEADSKLKPVLADMLSGCENASFVIADAMKTDINTLIADRFEGKGYRVIANLPYYITADLILRMIAARPLPESLCLMVQKEAAERLMSEPGDKNWGALAATVRYYAYCTVLEEVPPARFDPAPHVDSCFIRLDIENDRLFAHDPKKEAGFLKLVRACFTMRRKTLANNLKSAFSLPQALVMQAIEMLGEKPTVRGEVLAIETIARLYEILTGDLHCRI